MTTPKRPVPTLITEGLRIWLVCGSRDGFAGIKHALDSLVTASGKPDVVMHGGSRGVDTEAHLWARAAGIQTAEVAALWGYGGVAGPLRNSLMASMVHAASKGGADVRVIAFPGGRGTANMVQCAKGLGLHVIRVDVEMVDA